MDFFEAVLKRRSVRRYTTEAVPEEVIKRALEAAVVAPNSSNLQPWEFYWVQSPDKKSALVDACLFQGTAKTANHLIVAVSRVDTWKRNRDLLVQQMKKGGPFPKDLQDYYFKIVPFMYTQDPFGIFGMVKWITFNVLGLFKPVPRGPCFRSGLFETVTKTTALACENFMLAIAAQGFGSCPMEGFDERRVKKILKLGRGARVVMVIGVGGIDPAGIFGPQYRLDQDLIIHRV